jgi:hypothetical protein
MIVLTLNALSAEGAKERSLQYRAKNRVMYPFELPGFGKFQKQETGQKTFDFNVDGLAHVGLLPDMIADLKQIGLSDDDLRPLFRSAEGYIKVWERATGATSSPMEPGASCVSPTVTADQTCRAQASIAAPALADDQGVTLTQDPPGPYGKGQTSVKLTVTPKLGCDPPSSCTGIVTVVDETPPPITCPADVVAECTGPGTRVVFEDPILGADNCGMSMSSGCQPLSGASYLLGTYDVTCSASDADHNVASCGFSITVHDTVPPALATPPVIPDVECASPAGAEVSLRAPSATDTCDPGPTLSHDAPAGFIFPVGVTNVTWTARDASGNPSTTVQAVTVVDRTAPSITCPGTITAECLDGGATVTPGAATGQDICGDVSLTTHEPATFPLGTSTLEYAATDDSGNAARCTSDIVVEDTLGPAIASVGVSPGAVLWPPNHKMVAVAVQVVARDACDGARRAPVCRLSGISSNEPVNGLGDGDTATDWEITGPLSAKLRAERSGNGSGRVYTLEVTCRDEHDNTSKRATTVTVPHDSRES